MVCSSSLTSVYLRRVSLGAQFAWLLRFIAAMRSHYLRWPLARRYDSSGCLALEILGKLVVV
jgi:hypothetical protein